MSSAQGRKRYSEVWNYFTKEDDGGSAKCNICDSKLSFKSSSSNLKKHIVRKHAKQATAFTPGPMDPLNDPPSPASSSYAATTIKKQKLYNSPPKVNNHICKTDYFSNEEDECTTLARGYLIKLRKLSPEQLIFVDKVISAALFDAQMGVLNMNSYLVHPVQVCEQTSPTHGQGSPTCRSPRSNEVENAQFVETKLSA